MIVSHYDIEFQNHRSDFETCPKCGKKYKDEIWMKNIIVVILEPTFFKAENIVIVSECQSCFETSWIHEPFTMAQEIVENYGYPLGWIQKIENRKIQYFEDQRKRWLGSKCLTCRWRIEDVDFKRAYTSCEFMSTTVVNECDHYEVKENEITK